MNPEEKKEKRKLYMREYMRERNINIRGEPRKKMTIEEKKEKQKIHNRKKYLKNRNKLLEYARQKRETKTGIKYIDRIKNIYNTLTESEKVYIMTT